MTDQTQVRLNNYVSNISNLDKAELEEAIDTYNRSVELEGIDASSNNYKLDKKNIFIFIDHASNLNNHLGVIDLSSEEGFFQNTLPTMESNSISETEWLTLFADDPYNTMKVLATSHNQADLIAIENDYLLQLDQLSSKYSSLQEEEKSLRSQGGNPEKLRENLSQQGSVNLRTFLVLRTLTKISTIKLCQDPSDEMLVNEYKLRSEQMSELNVIPFSGMPN